MSEQTLAERIDVLYAARLRNPENPENELEFFTKAVGWCSSADPMPVLKYRLKPKTVTREITHPEPLRDAPEPGVKVYRAAPEISERYDLVYWHSLDYQAQWMRDGLLHSTKEAAIAHGKALAGVSDE